MPGSRPWKGEDVAAVITNPFYAIEIHPELRVPHELMIPEDVFVEAGVRFIQAHGPEEYIRRVLANLKGEVYREVHQ
jgi:hypothetical protein